jgi:hypothetical protein
MAKMLGMPALKLWQVMESWPGEQKSGKRSANVLFMIAQVRFFPEEKRKTGKDSSEFPTSSCFALRFLRACTGQQS